DNVPNQGVVAIGQELEKPPFDADSMATGPQKKHSVLTECLPILHAGSGLEISQQFRPVVSVGLPKQFDEPLTLPAGWGLLQRHFKQDRIPPAHFIVAVITEETRIIAQSENLFASDGVHAVDDLRVPHVPPRRAGSRADVQNRRKGKLLRTGVP